MHGRVTVVEERYLGTTLSEDATGVPAVGIVGVLGTGTGGSTVTITLTEDAVGDSIVIAGGADGARVPDTVTDTPGNTYYLGVRSGHGGAGPDNNETNGLDGTVWIIHGEYDVGKPQSGDTIVITFSGGTPADTAAVAIDCEGVAAVSSDDAGSAGRGDGSPSGSFTPSSGKTIANDDSPYFAAVFGKNQTIIPTFGDPSIDSGTLLGSLTAGEHTLVVMGDMASAGADPARVMTAGVGYAEGIVQAYITAPATGNGSITVDDATDLDAAGELQVLSSDGLTTEIISYSAIDEDTGEITLVGNPLHSYAADDGVKVLLYPLSVERWAVLIENDNPEDEEGLWARVPHALYDKMPVGVRDLYAGEGETVDAGYVGEELVITDVTAQQPLIDGSYIDTSTLPAATSDGDPPSGSPTPDVRGGAGYLTAVWDEVTNADPVTYEVHISTSNGFTPDGTTLFAETPATSIVLDTLADHSTALVYGTTYYVKLVEFDADGSAAAGTQGSGVPTMVGTGDIADGSVTSAKILDGTIANVDVSSSAAIAYSKLALTGDILNADLAGSIAYSKLVLTGSIVNADVASGAAIAYSKLALTGAILNADLAGSISASKITGTAITAADTGTVTSTMIADGTIVNADINASAAIAYSKLALTGAILNADLAGSIAASKITGTAVTQADTGTVTSTMILDGTILNADVNASAAIAYTKLALTGSIVNADIASGAAIAYSKLALTGAILNADLAGSIAASKVTGTAVTQADTGTVTSTMIADGTILNADINASAAIVYSKLALTTTSGSSAAFVANRGNAQARPVTSSFTINTTGAVANGNKIIVALTFDTGFGATTCAISGGGLTWSTVTNQPSSAGQVMVIEADAPGGLSSATTLTFTFDNTVIGYIVCIEEWTGMATGVPVANNIAVGSGTSSSPLTANTVNSAAATDGVFCVVVTGGSINPTAGNWTPNSGFTKDAVQAQGGNHAGMATEYATGLTPGVQSGGFTETDGATAWKAVAVIFPGAATTVGTIVNADISGSAGILYSKLLLTGSILNADLAGSISASKITGTAVTQADTGTVTSTMILDGTILNADVNASAAIAYSKLALTGAVLNADLAGSIAYSKLVLTGSIVNADISSSAAIAYSKLALTGAILNADLAGSISPSKITGTAVTAADTGTVTSTMILDGTILNADVNASAAIAYSKLSLTGAILNADLAGSIAPSKITGTAITAADTGTVTSTMIADGTIVNADVSASAAIAYSKLALTGAILNADLAGSIAPSKITGTAITAADTGTVTSTMIADGTILNADINASAAIAYSKLALTGAILNADLAGSIAASKISGTAVTQADTGTVTSTMLLDGTILNADVNSSAGILTSKLAKDGSVPASMAGTSPNVLGNARGIMANWTPITNNDPAYYNVYVSTDVRAATYDFETGVETWVHMSGNSTVSQSTDQAKIHTNSLKVVCNGAATNLGAQTPPGTKVTVSPATQYTVSMWIYAPTGSTIQMEVDEYNGASFVGSHKPATIAGDNAWHQVSSTFTTNASTNGLVVEAYQTIATAVTFYIDAVQVETGAAVSAFRFTPGSTNLYAKTPSSTIDVFTLNGGTAFTAGTSYYVVVSAQDADGEGTASDPSLPVSLSLVVNADVSASAAIAYSKLALSGAILNADLAGSIAASKISGTAVTQGDTGTVSSTMIADGTILNADVNASAAIAYSKLALTGAILNADLAGSIAASKISGTAVTQADTGTVTSTMILDGTILNADINASAAIAATKISGTALVLNAANVLASGGSIASLGTGLTAAWSYGADGSFVLPRVTTGQRLGSPSTGQLEKNESDDRVEWYDGSTNGYRQLATVGDALGGPSFNVNLLRGLSKAQAVKTGSLLAETVPWELALLSCNAKATPGGQALANQRLTLQAVWLEQGQIVTGLQQYCLSAYTATPTDYTLGLWTYDGTTYTCVVASGQMNVGTGMRGSTALNYTVPSSGIYYVGILWNSGGAAAGTTLMFVDGGGLLLQAGDFTGRLVNAGFSSTNWPRVTSFSTTTSQATSGGAGISTHAGPGTVVQNMPWVGVLGTIL